MATAGLPLWSTTAASNATADPAVNMAEGMAPSALNDSIRALMASVAKARDDWYGITTGGTSTAYTITTGSTFATAAAMSGVIFTIIPNATNGAAPTLAVDGLTARAINQSTGVAVATGELISGTPYLVKYVHASTEFILIGRTKVVTDFTTTGTLTQSTTGQEILAKGTTGQRPADAAGGFRFNTTLGFPEFNAGAGWVPLLATLAGAQTPYGAIINGTISESRSANATTYALKTLAGTDPSATDPVLIGFRNATIATGNYVYRTVTGALSLTISSGSTLGATSAIPFKLWVTLFDDAGTIRMGVINCLSGSNIFPLGKIPLASSTAEGGLGAADSAHVFYTGTAVTTKAYAILGYASYETGLTAAGAWDAAPTRLQLFGAGVPLPGDLIQSQGNASGAAATGTDLVPDDDTIPLESEGDVYLTQLFTPTSAANVLECAVQGYFSNTGGGQGVMSLYSDQDGSTNALASSRNQFNATSVLFGPWCILHRMLAAVTVETSFTMQFGSGTAGTNTFNGTSGSRKIGGALNSYIIIKEFMA